MEPMVEEKQDGQNSRIKLYFSVFILNLVFFSSGCAFSWSSPTLPKLMAETKDLNASELTITANEASWIVSLLSLGNILGPFVAAVLLDLIGRRWTIFLDVMCIICSWAIISQKFSIYMLYIGRFFMGITIGITFSALPLYIAEISEDSVRGALNNFMQIFISSSILFTYSIGPFTSYNGLIIYSCIPCIIFLLFFPWLPETPYYLISKKKNNTAFLTLQWLRGSGTDSSIEREMKAIQAELSESIGKKGSFKDLILHPGTRHALFITSGLVALQQFTGIGIVIFYAEPIFKMTGTSMSSSVCAILVGAVMLTTGIFGPLIINKFGYKTPLLVSASGMTITHAILGTYLALYLRHFEVVNNLNWIPVVGINIFIIFHTMGFSFIPWSLMGELFSPEMKTIGAPVVTSICAFFCFGLANVFPNVADLLGIDSVFFIFSLFSIISFFFVIYFVPNTSGMSLAEIQTLMNSLDNSVKK